MLIDGNDENHPEGSYFIEWWDRRQAPPRSGRRLMLRMPPTRPASKQAELTAQRNGIIPAAPALRNNPERTTLPAALDRLSGLCALSPVLRTFRTYRPILESFKTFCPKTYVDDVERQDLLDFATHCMKNGQKGKSIYNKLVVISQVMKQHGKTQTSQAADWPSFVETVRPIYEDFELTKLFKACARHRGSPVQVLSDVRIPGRRRPLHHLARCGFQTHGRARYRKTALGISSEELGRKGSPGSAEAIAMLQKFRPANATPDDPLFPSATGRPDGAMLEKLKAVAYRGKLNCGHCA